MTPPGAAAAKCTVSKAAAAKCTASISAAAKRTASISAAALALAACATSPASIDNPKDSHVVTVVAAENFWGSIASQIGGRHTKVTSIIANPDIDPHSYEPTVPDARQIAGADLVVVNGIGYDSWATKAVAADWPEPRVLDVGHLLGLHDGDNPHRWYNPSDVKRVVSALASDLSAEDPGDGGFFAQRATSFETVSLAAYDSLIATINSRYAGTPVGASESIFSMLAPALGLDLVTPHSFLRAISEGTDVLASDKATIDGQIKNHLIKIYVYNAQNTTPDVQAQLTECRHEGIPTAQITETLTPPSATYQQWQVRQLEDIRAALAKATSH